MAKAALREAARLGAMAVEETGYGVPDDKREKNRLQQKTSGTIFAVCARWASSPSRKT